MTFKHVTSRYFALSALASSLILLNLPTYALQEMSEQDLRKIDGQDGVQVTVQYDQVDLDQLYWQDNAGSSSGTVANAAGVDKELRANANGVVIKANSSGVAPGTVLELDAGSNGSTAGLSLSLQSNPSLITVNSLNICDTEPGICGSSLGSLAIESTSPSKISLVTSDGLFNQNKQATINLGLVNNNVYISHASPTGSNLNNQLILKNLNFNFAAKGAIFITDSGGLVLQTNVGSATPASLNQAPNNIYGYADLTRVAKLVGTPAGGTYNGTTSGLNLELMTKKDADMTLGDPYSLDNAKGLIRVGANGRVVNASLQVRGVNATGAADPAGSSMGNILGKATTGVNPTPSGDNATVIGSTGIAARMYAEFTKSGDSMLAGGGEATTLEIGGAGDNTYGFEFGELSPLVVGSSQRAYFDSGNVYLNLTDTKQLLMPQNAALNAAKFGANGTVTSADDYTQYIHTGTGNTNPYAMVLAVRGMDFQAVSKRGRFTSTAGNSPAHTFIGGTDNKWGLGLPFYNVNANLALSGTTSASDTPIFALDNNNNVVRSTVSNTQRLGLSLALSAQGLSDDGSKTTSIMVVDAVNNQYIGLRNIDMLLKGTGSMGFENGSVNMSLPDLLIVMAGQVAAGYLPGAMNSSGVKVSDTNFASNNDVLFGLKLRLQGAMDFSLIPNNNIDDGAKLSIVGDFNMPADTVGNTIQISEPTDGSVLGFDNIVGKIRFNNSIAISRNSTTAGTLNPGEGKVGFNAEFTFNPDHQPAEVFRVKDINLYPSVQTGTGSGATFSTGAPQRLGEMVITGGRISSQLGIVPRN
ncbi:hypothetical protein ACF3NA_07405 [Alkanindiges sp. WGS2144]|uniref:hypothetical protein n=1 Tax=Alkanindiges sp. WGS2144 TaxID=3366808 RepID=UPI0037531617